MEDAYLDDNGTQKLVIAASFRGKCKDGKVFYCPECGEPVRLCSAENDNQQKPHFRHCHENQYTKACGRRMEGCGSGTASCTNTFYQSIGLPICLRRTDSHTFDLEITFYPLGANLLRQAEKQNARVTIRSENNTPQNFQINRRRFLQDRSSRYSIGIMTIPTDSYGLSYDIQAPSYDTQTSSLQAKLEKCWGTTAEGFCYALGMLFLREYGGRKVRRGGIAVLGKSYYLLWKSSDYIPRCLQPFFKKVGSLGTRSSYPIYQMKIPSSVLDYVYQMACEFLWERFHVRLLRTAPKIVPLWPPSVQSEDIFHVSPLPKVVSSNDVWISVANHMGSIYWHADPDYGNGHTCAEIQPKRRDTISGSSLYKISIPKNVKLRPITVDKSPTSERCFLEWHVPKYIGFQEKIEITEVVEKQTVSIPITPEGITISSPETTLKVSVPFQASVVHRSGICDSVHKCTCKRELYSCKLKKCHPGDLLIIRNAWREIRRIPIRQPQMSHGNVHGDRMERLQLLLQRPCAGSEVPIPGWACELIRIHLFHSPVFLQMRPFWIRGILPVSILVALKKFKSEGENQ